VVQRVQEITRETLVPIGLVAALVIVIMGATWAIATDRQQAVEQIRANAAAVARHDAELRELRGQMQYLTQAMIRIETKLGTLPKGGYQR